MQAPAFRFCPVCAATLESPRDACQKCRNCGTTHYHKAKPCVAVVVAQGGRVLLSRRGIEPLRGKWEILGGFIDLHETAEQAAMRELKEETGLDIVIDHYLGSFIDRYGDTSEITLNFAFASHFDAGAPQPGDDVAQLQWFQASELPSREEFAFSNSWDALQAWRALS